jgi:acetyl-CoA carboxylase, biotin carboxylase subunit
VRRVMIANRGEIALRVMRACRELGLESIAVYSEADASALHVRKADHAVNIGKAAARFSYLNPDVLIDAARQSGADAVHPGYGFLSENADFARACQQAGLVWVGPPAEAIEQMGDKAAARKLADRANVPIVPGTDGTIAPTQAVATAEEIGYPVMLKATAGGGGKGIRIARDADELQDGVAVAAREARAAFGDPSLYLEKLLVSPRHVEIQVLADTHGNVVHLYERECSLQRRRQKLLEESPSPALDQHTREDMAAAAVRLAKAAGYTNAGTVEFLLEGSGSGEFYFIEMNTRIQVEHPVTEMVTGIDLVKEQLRIAAGERLAIAQDEIQPHGAAIEFRITAENADQDFHPSPGQITCLEIPGGPGVRLDTALYAGYTVPPFYDSLIAKLIVWGIDREEAIARGRRALEELVIEGIDTTIPFHLHLLEHPGFRRGEYHTEYLSDLALA